MTAPRKPFFPAEECIRAVGDAELDIQKLGIVDYLDAWHLQADLAAQRAKDDIPDTVLVLEHPNIYTAGKRTQPEDRPTNGLPVINVDRGGRITWHGLGQMVVYPIIKLADPVDVVDYVRRLEEALIYVCRQVGLDHAGRIDGRSGVWLPADHDRPDRKLAAIGIRITRGVTMHGVALNCNNTLEYYHHIVPCGISDAGVSTLSEELQREVKVDEIADIFLHALREVLSGRMTVADHTLGCAPDPCKGLPRRT
ncbi:lipoyl(octanoyl) transferase LipB [Corynebacterium poyangense]|uniref:Octanoyltransferase n=1 Tax=Corynebacterium poyangense TaxID=2684405 RepID=A0A7H0SPX0_9CORY|nr:lipoyl(octanoyl) transferase LipB [Corynebacterium poyangense]MBZ8178481.1 lipoyl(octanoyl) transferase LipB [Corynebacterium poyangense]QNQ90595.1 lipoyl(octanoyl) transferase LipB [Corynebacterium poyangense]